MSELVRSPVAVKCAEDCWDECADDAIPREEAVQVCTTYVQVAINEANAALIRERDSLRSALEKCVPVIQYADGVTPSLAHSRELDMILLEVQMILSATTEVHG